MDKKDTLKGRMKQLLAADTNAAEIYTELATMTEDDSLKEQFKNIAEDEKKHIKYFLQLLSIL